MNNAECIEKTIEGVISAEEARGRALESDDFETLRHLIAADITHTHTRGVTDDYDSYFRYIETELQFLECRRGPLKVKILGDIAVMSGTMHNVVRKRGTDGRILTDAQTLQVWEWRDDRWILTAFQSTSLPKDA